MCADGGLFAACWFQLDDNRAEDLTKEVSKWRAWHAMAAFLDLRRLLLHASQGMRQGIITSGAFILFLSAGILTRPFCRFLILDGACARLLKRAFPSFPIML